MSGNLDIVAQPKLPEGRTGFVGFGFALIAFGGGLELHFEIEPWGRYESAENLGVEIHPFLRWDYAAPSDDPLGCWFLGRFLFLVIWISAVASRGPLLGLCRCQ